MTTTQSAYQSGYRAGAEVARADMEAERNRQRERDLISSGRCCVCGQELTEPDAEAAGDENAVS